MKMDAEKKPEIHFGSQEEGTPCNWFECMAKSPTSTEKDFVLLIHTFLSMKKFLDLFAEQFYLTKPISQEYHNLIGNN